MKAAKGVDSGLQSVPSTNSLRRLRRVRRTDTTVGAAWVVLGGVLLTTIAAVAKLLDDRVHVFQLTLARSVFGLALMIPVGLARHGVPVFVTGSLALHVARGFVSVLAMTAAFYAVIHLPLATATSIAFAAPLFITVLARFLLGEAVSALRWACVGLTIIGALIIFGGTMVSVLWGDRTGPLRMAGFVNRQDPGL